MKWIKGCIVLVLLATVSAELYVFAPAFNPKHPYYMPFLDGNGEIYKVTPRYYAKEIANIFLSFSMLLSLSVITHFLSKRAAVFFWLFAAYKCSNIFLYWYNHCTWALPFYIAIGLMISWAVFLFGWVKEPGAKVIKM